MKPTKPSSTRAAPTIQCSVAYRADTPLTREAPHPHDNDQLASCADAHGIARGFTAQPIRRSAPAKDRVRAPWHHEYDAPTICEYLASSRRRTR